MSDRTAALPPALAAHTDRVSLQDPVFISDLHLNAAQPATLQRFLSFVRNTANQHKELVILGDLFEYWTGDDIDIPVAQQVADALRDLATQGTRVFIMQGNRDLLLGRAYCERASAVLLADPTIATIGAEPVLLAHGDAYCTRDAGYMRFRAFARNPRNQRVFLWLPRFLRKAFVGAAREHSKAGKRSKPMDIMDVSPEAVIADMQRASVTRLIHGHTHRPATHRFTIDGKPTERWVLPDWDFDQASVRGGYLHNFVAHKL